MASATSISKNMFVVCRCSVYQSVSGNLRLDTCLKLQVTLFEIQIEPVLAGFNGLNLVNARVLQPLTI